MYMDKKALKVLEFNKITDMLSDRAASELGRSIISELAPSTDIDTIRRAQKETSEAVSMILKKGEPSFGGLRNIEGYIKRVNVSGALNAGELLNICDFLRASRRLKDYGRTEGKNDSFPLLEPCFDGLEPIIELERDIERSILSPNEIADDASRKLRDIRRSIRIANDRIKEQLNSVIHSAAYKNMLQESVITIRNERYCVPVKQEYKNAFAGLIHDQSSTGATVFIEPIGVVQLNNKIKELHSEEKAEIERILALLSLNVAEHADTLLSNQSFLSHLDFVFAKGSLSVSMQGTEPVFNTDGAVNIKKARHPLLDSRTVVPTDIYIGKKFNTLLITGPNTGGKTVSLKTLGLFTLMGQSGLHIPAFDNSQLAVFDNVFADIGDEQSIEQSLSTFSSHMTNIVRILNEVTPSSLVLLDELGAGTDPTEGAALAAAIIKRLHAMGVRTAVTTHYSELKVFALSTDGVENAACEFDVETLRPTYRLLIGVPGKSNAFAISKRLGLPDYVIDEAKEVLSREDLRFEDVITDLEISRKSLLIEQERAEEYRKEAQQLKNEAQQQRSRLELQREKILRAANEKAREIVSQAKDEADSILKQMRKLYQEGINTHELEELRSSLKDKLEKADKSLAVKADHKVPDKLVKGDKVHIHSLNRTGIVSAPPNKNGDVTVKAGIMTISVNIKDLSLDDSEDRTAEHKKYASGIARAKKSSISSEVDLRGMLTLEAIDKLDKYIDDAYLAGVSPVTIIHGKGTGALRQAVHDYLRRSPGVKSYRLGQFGEGDAGVTIAELK